MTLRSCLQNSPLDYLGFESTPGHRNHIYHETEHEERLSKIEERNKRVEADKAWEASWTRRVGIMLLTYLVVAAYLYFVVHVNPWINALVPVIGFLLSTLTISLLKGYWLDRRKK